MPLIIRHTDTELLIFHGNVFTLTCRFGESSIARAAEISFGTLYSIENQQRYVKHERKQATITVRVDE